MGPVVTGDAVVLELRRAEPASRALALALDLCVMVPAFLLLSSALTPTLEYVDSSLGATLGIVTFLLAFVAYPIALETLTHGRSLGKMAFGLRVVRTDGGPIRFRHALARGLAGLIVDFGLVSFFTGAIAVLSALLSAQGQRLGDRLAGTIVVRERVPTTPTQPVPMPPPLAAWAAGLQLSGLPDPLALTARQLLARAAALDPAARERLARELAGRVAGHVSPPPPPGTPPEPYLAATLAERRRRDDARLAPAVPPPAAPYLPQQRPAVVPAPTPAPSASSTSGGFALPR